MSEIVGLAATDAAGRWIGIRRHQSVLVIIGLLLVGDFIVRAANSSDELVTGVILLLAAVPTVDGLTVAEFAVVAGGYLIRPKWLRVRLRTVDDVVVVDARAKIHCRGFELTHRGRLDLSGRAERDATAFGEFVDSLAVRDDDRHVSVHVCARDSQRRTLLSLPPETRPPEMWVLNNDLTRRVAHAVGDDVSWHLERWGYLRRSIGVVSVMRVCDFSGARSKESLLERVQLSCGDTDVAVHVDVIGARRAARLSARAVHRQGSDDASSLAAGFRRSARSARASQRTREREILVAAGRALLRLSVFLVVHADTVDELGERVAQVRRRAADAGLQCERGGGRQAMWFSLQLPGGPGW